MTQRRLWSLVILAAAAAAGCVMITERPADSTPPPSPSPPPPPAAPPQAQAGQGTITPLGSTQRGFADAPPEPAPTTDGGT